MKSYGVEVLISVSVLFVFSAVAHAQAVAKAPTTIPNTATGAPDLSGVWVSAVGAGIGRRERGTEAVNPAIDETDDSVFRHSALPLQPWAEEKFNYNRSPYSPYTQGRNELNPYLTVCSPQGPTVDWQFGTFPFEIIQSPKRILIIFERDHEIRQIWTDGREHPKDFGHNWFGHSIGHWEGETLVADTIGLNDLTWFDKAGHVHSDALHVVERFQRVRPTNLLVTMTFDDPKTFTTPWGAFRNFYLEPTWELEEEILCEDKFLGKQVPLE